MMRSGSSIHYRIHKYLMLLVAAVLPFGSIALSVVIALLFVNWLAGKGFGKNTLSCSAASGLLLSVLLYVAYIAGLFYTSDMDYAMRDLETKLSLILLPLVVGFNYPLSRKHIYQLLLVFVGSCSLAVFICLIRAISLSGFIDTSYFFYMKLSYFLHPSYFSMYIVLCMIACFLFVREGTFPVKNAVWYMLIFFFLFIQLMLAAKAGLIITFLLILVAITYQLIIRKKVVSGIIALIAMLIIAVIAVKDIPILKERLNALRDATEKREIDKASSESNAVRLLIWETDLELIGEYFWTGTGTGDVKDELLKRYKEKGMTGAYAHRLNAHNQFFQTWITLGVGGFLLLSAGLLLPFYLSIRKKHVLYAVFIVVIALNFMVESMLETQAGVIFYAFFNALFLSRMSPDT